MPIRLPAVKQMIELMGEPEAERIGFQSVTESIDTTTLSGKLVFHMVHTAASSKTYSNRSATMVLDRRPPAERKPCDATAATQSVGDGRHEP